LKRLGGREAQGQGQQLQQQQQHQKFNDITSRIGKHGIITLNGTLLLEANPQFLEVPNTFQLATKEGHVHTFQAGNKNAYLRWTQCISERIVLCQENSSFELTDGIIYNETIEKHNRFVNTLATPLYNSSSTRYTSSSSLLLSTSISIPSSSNHDNDIDHIQSLLNFGIRIAELKEQCNRTYNIKISNKSMLHHHDIPKSSPQRRQSQPQPPTDQYIKCQQQELMMNTLTAWNSINLLLTNIEHLSFLFTKMELSDIDVSKVWTLYEEIKKHLYNFQQEYVCRGDDIVLMDSSIQEYCTQKVRHTEGLFDQVFDILSGNASKLEV